jgi:hypothetical protein
MEMCLKNAAANKQQIPNPYLTANLSFLVMCGIANGRRIHIRDRLFALFFRIDREQHEVIEAMSPIVTPVPEIEI